MIAFLSKIIPLLALCASAGAQTITVGAEDDWAPYSSVVDGKAQGFAVDVVRAAFAAVGIKAEFEVLPYVRCLAKARGQAGRLFRRGAERHDRPALSVARPSPVYYPHECVRAGRFRRPGDERRQARRQDRGRGARLRIHGDEFDLNKKIVRKVVDKNEQGFKMLQAGRIEYMAAEQRIADALFRRYPDAFGGKFKVA
ncbi:ABC transporter substrate-binding protein [Massilia sp. H-1]|nr:ABC transporter substrate-binding protein [Massilia sp. H-1]